MPLEPDKKPIKGWFDSILDTLSPSPEKKGIVKPSAPEQAPSIPGEDEGTTKKRG